MKRLGCLATLLLICLMFCLLCGCGGSNSSGSQGSATGSGSTETTGNVVGTVTDGDSLEALDNAVVSIGTQTATTDENGDYSLRGIPAGTATISVTRTDYDRATATVEVTAGNIVKKDIFMGSNMGDWLEGGTTYKWQVIAVQADGTNVAGPEWTFTTENGNASISPVTVTRGIDIDSAQNVVETFCSREKGTAFSIASNDRITDKTGAPLAYIFSLNPTGYVIVPASRENVLPPVLAYSFDNSPPEQKSGNPMIGMIRLDIQQRLAALQEGEVIQTKTQLSNESLWDSYLAGEASPVQKAVNGPYLYYPGWGQRKPYYNECPNDPVTQKRCLVGCVATAYAQIFNSWETPTAINSFSGTYTTKTRKIVVDCSKANFTNFDYKKGYPDDDSLARLSFACGVIAKMNYSSKVSLANVFTFGKRLSGKYGYAETSEKRFARRDTIDTKPIIDNLTLGMKLSRPVVMAIFQVDEDGDLSNGHAIVVDGYDSDKGTFHLNMGWYDKFEGNSGWYSLPGGMPSNYSVISGYVYNIRPKSPTAASIVPPGSFRGTIPDNPFPRNGGTDFPIDEVLTWDNCDNAVLYNCYLWKAGEAKPPTPNITGLTDSVIDPNDQIQ